MLQTLLGEAVGSAVASFVMNVIVLWVSQKVILPSEKEKGLLSIIALSLVGAIVMLLLSWIPYIGWLVSWLAWVWLIKAWFGIGWTYGAFIAALAYILYLIVGYIVGLPRAIAMIDQMKSLLGLA